jgi:hypothetical protein
LRGLWPSLWADLQLTPRISQDEEDGVKFRHLAFSDGGAKEITYSAPAWVGTIPGRISNSVDPLFLGGDG